MSRTTAVTLTGAIAIGIGGMVGGGIFAVLGVAAEQAGGATPIAFLSGGIVAALTAYSYARLSVRYPSAGGTVTFIDRIFGVETLTGGVNIVLWAGYIATTGLYAAAFGHYAATLLPGDAETSAVAFKSLAVLGVFVPWIVNLTNAGLVARTERAVVATKLAILMVVVAAGVPAATVQRLDPATWSSPGSIIAAGMLIFVAYEGFELISNAAGDVVNPSRTLPRAYAWSVGVVIALYVMISAVVVGSLTPAEITASSDFALAETASTSLGRAGFTMVALAAVLATFSAINATLYGTARLSFTLAVEGELPPEFRRRPWDQPIGLHITAVLGVAIAVGLPLESIAGLSSSIFLIVFSVVNAAAFRADAATRVRRPVAAAGFVCSAASLVVLTARSVTTDRAALFVLVPLLAMALVSEFFVLRVRRRKRRAPTPTIEHGNSDRTSR